MKIFLLAICLAFSALFSVAQPFRINELMSSNVGVIADMDGDRDLDALVGTANGAVVWINQGGDQGGQAGVFASSWQEITTNQTSALAGSETTAVFLADLDGDRDTDALIAGNRQAVIWWNNGKATFEQSNQRFRFSPAHGLGIGDFNGDGSPDICSAAYEFSFRAWFNQGNGTFRSGNP